jgi:hypothetical protein
LVVATVVIWIVTGEAQLCLVLLFIPVFVFLSTDESKGTAFFQQL